METKIHAFNDLGKYWLDLRCKSGDRRMISSMGGAFEESLWIGIEHDDQLFGIQLSRQQVRDLGKWLSNWDISPELKVVRAIEAMGLSEKDVCVANEPEKIASTIDKL